ncbi:MULTISPECIES: Rrf2 family transcriptional regulator [Lacrimispora]|uniref:RrF2 family transcriptional regulator n=1 Tax=Lacrimispora TaxID=2719231 RepID=UPI000BE42E21|nr:Rrf2 family transcriptional regulator [Lacrimispora amygdalina]MDK2967287.1 Rrf2 family transcriptional regulator, cysteine metabolism repressor [Lacrimispora sp.]
MKFSTKGRYALRMMIEFALRPGECTKINHVAERQDISDKYLEQIVTILSRAGFVKSRRGAQGGYYLTKDPSEYTVGMILRLAEGSLVPVSCMEEEVNSCSRADICASMIVWKKLDQAISDVVDSITLADLVTEQKRLEGMED